MREGENNAFYLPVLPCSSAAADTGVPIVYLNPDSYSSQAFIKVADELVKSLPPKERVVVKEHAWEEDRMIDLRGSKSPEAGS